MAAYHGDPRDFQPRPIERWFVSSPLLPHPISEFDLERIAERVLAKLDERPTIRARLVDRVRAALRRFRP